MNNINVLLYSRQCPSCKNLLTILQNEKLLQYFKLECVDDTLDKYPRNLIVPTMLVVNVNRPLMGQETFEWVNQMKFIKQQNIAEMNKKIIQQNTNIRKGPIGYDSDIMGGISDKFAFTKIDEPLPHTYFGIGDEEKNAIFTPPVKLEKEKMSKYDQEKTLKNIQSLRSNQDTESIAIAKQIHYEAVMKAEKEKFN
jgi:hypothetical protein